MEERQTQIREGAGLEESRLNVEFIDWLRKWSSPILIAIALLALAYVGFQKLQAARIGKVNTAFREYTAVADSNAPSPESLKGVAEQYGAIRGIGVMARLEAADAYMAAIRTGVRPGAAVEADGSVKDAGDLLAAEDRTRILGEAEALYRAIADESASKPAMLVHRVSALYGLAAVAESRDDLAAAKGFYEKIVAEGEPAGFVTHVKIARDRIAGLDALPGRPALPAEAEVPPLPWAELPPAPIELPIGPPAIEPLPEQPPQPSDQPAEAPAEGEQPADQPGEQPPADPPGQPK